MKFGEIAPPGREKQVKKLKKKFDDPGAPYAIAWAQHNKHGKPNKKEALGESDDTTYVKMVIQKYPQEWKKFTDTGDLMDAPNIYEKLFVYFHFDTGEMPYGTAKARDGDPYVWIADKLADLGLVEQIQKDVPTQKGRDAKPEVLTKRAMNVVKKSIKHSANKQRRRMDKDAVGEDDNIEEAPFGKAVKSALSRVAQRTATNIKGKLGSIPGIGDLKTAATGQQAIDKTSDQVWNQYVQFKQTGPDKNQTVNWFKTQHGMDISPNELDPQGNIDKTGVEKAVKSALAKKQSGVDKEQQPNQPEYQFKKGDEIKWTDANGKQQTARVVDPDKGPGDQKNMMTVQQGNRGTIPLSKDRPFPADSQATQDDKVAIAQLQKIDPTANQTTLRAVNSVAGGKAISGQLQQVIQPLMKKITRALKDANKRQKLSIALAESLSQSDLSKLDILAREGLVDKKNVTRFKTAMRILAKEKELPISYKDDVIGMVSKLAKIITKPSVMGMVRKGLKEEHTTTAQEKFKTWVNQANDIIS